LYKRKNWQEEGEAPTKNVVLLERKVNVWLFINPMGMGIELWGFGGGLGKNKGGGSPNFKELNSKGEGIQGEKRGGEETEMWQTQFMETPNLGGEYFSSSSN